MSYPPSSGSPYTAAPYAAPHPPAPKGRKGPVILLLSGVFLALLGVIVLVVCFVSVARVSDDMAPIAADGTTTVQLESTAIYGLYGNGLSTCTAQGPDGNATIDGPSSSTTINGRRLFGVLTVKVSGDYDITCSTASVDDVYLGPLIKAQDIVRSVFGVFVGAGMAIVGVPLLIAGLIWLVVRNSNNKKALQAQAAGYAGGRPGY
ncbi:hypothetical protein [Actinomyces sp. MRS3W]|uniref:hypothetical protein n=1 Tax=Actinomyces sp. MRS3W TaxID=2800796 RepID=UPI0028FD358E|nr:hypothetical protein [Actinomyces sp. MRS3W]MDU0348266.1 hypothetical protein [Actinomyces sp. MRS3W]